MRSHVHVFLEGLYVTGAAIKNRVDYSKNERAVFRLSSNHASIYLVYSVCLALILRGLSCCCLPLWKGITAYEVHPLAQQNNILHITLTSRCPFATEHCQGVISHSERWVTPEPQLKGKNNPHVIK